MAGLAPHGLPLPRGREGGTTPAEQPGGVDQVDHAGRADLAGALAAREAAVGEVRVEVERIGAPGAGEQHQVPVSGLRDGRNASRLGRGDGATRHEFLHQLGGDVPDRRATRRFAGFGDEHGGGLLAHSETWRRVGAVGKFASASLDATDQVDADMDLACRPLAGREQPVEGDDAMDLGGRHVEAFGDVVDGCRADPAHPVVDGVQRRQQQVTACSERPAADPVVRTRRLVGPEYRVDGGAFGGGGLDAARLQVHGDRRTLTAGGIMPTSRCARRRP